MMHFRSRSANSAIGLTEYCNKLCRAGVFGLGLAFVSVLTASSAFGQTVDYYAGTNSAGKDFEVYVLRTAQGPSLYSTGFTGDEYCNGLLVPAANLGGSSGGDINYPIINGRVTFSELRPEYFIAADIRFLDAGKVSGTAIYKKAIYTGPDFPPVDRDVTACSTREVRFTATYVGSLPLARVSLPPRKR